MYFTKMEGLGNDYIIINLIRKNKLEDLRKIAKTLSDRHFGIGGDGLIVIEESNIADYKMRIFNNDGSEAEMCGNGIRCVGKYLYDHDYTNKRNLTIETKAGIMVLSLSVINDKVDSVTVDMGVPKLYDGGVIYDGNQFVDIDYRKYDFDYVSMGNPHAIVFVSDVNEIDVDKCGEIISNDYHFPNKTNVEFVQILNDNNIKMRVFERGSRETLACGTGACASVVACVRKNLTKRKVKVKLLGGNLGINFDTNNHLYMTGQAREVYTGKYNI